MFSGPFDLLLFFIERDELDIHDIPIARITQDFLAYLRQLEALNLDVASEFILVAATLMQIKARMLLPRQETDEQGNEIDPRRELVQHLLEYKKYKSVVPALAALEEARATQEVRGNALQELRQIAERSGVDAELQDLDLYKLLQVYQKVMGRYQIAKNRPVHTVEQYPYTISGQKEWILLQLQGRQRLSFADIIGVDLVKIAVIYNFLAMLELIQSGLVTLQIGEGFNNFWIEKREKATAVNVLQ